MTVTPIAIVAAVVTDAKGRVLLVRKRGTAAFMQPGGKPEAGEDDLAALRREIDEELGCAIDSAVALGTFSAAAANEAGRVVVASVFRVTLSGVAAPRAEIEELVWIDPEARQTVPLAPLTRDHIFPALVAASARENA